MSAEQVWRMRCDGPCKGWLSTPQAAYDAVLAGHSPAVPNEALECHATARTAGMWPTRGAAEVAARGAGWDVEPNCRLDAKPHDDCEFNVYCKDCREGRECKTDTTLSSVPEKYQVKDLTPYHPDCPICRKRN